MEEEWQLFKSAVVECTEVCGIRVGGGVRKGSE